MGIITIAVIVFETLIFMSVIGLLIYLIVKRREDKRNETFEQRDN